MVRQVGGEGETVRQAVRGAKRQGEGHGHISFCTIPPLLLNDLVPGTIHPS